MATTRAQGAVPAPREDRRGTDAAPAPHPLHKALTSAAFSALLIVGLSVPIIALKTEQDINNQLVLVQRWGLVGIFALVAFGAAFGVSLQRGTLGRFLILIGSFLAGVASLRRGELTSLQMVALAGQHVRRGQAIDIARERPSRRRHPERERPERSFGIELVARSRRAQQRLQLGAEEDVILLGAVEHRALAEVIAGQE